MHQSQDQISSLSFLTSADTC